MNIPWRLLATNGLLGVLGNLGQLAVLVTAYRLWLVRHDAGLLDTWLVLVAIASFGALCDLGITGAVVQRMAAMDEDGRAAWRLACNRFLYRSLAVGPPLAGLAAWWWLSGRLPGPEAAVGGSSVMLWCACIVWTTYQSGLLKASLRFGAASGLLVAQQTALFLLPCLAPAKSGLVTPACIAVAALAVTLALGTRMTRWDSTAILSQPPGWRQLLGAGSPYAAQNALAFFYSHFQRLAIASTAMAGDVAALAAAQSVFGKAQALIGAAGEALNPAVAKGLIHPRLFWRAMAISAGICAGGFLLLAMMAHIAFAAWLPGDVGRQATAIVPILAVGYAMAASTAVAVHILNGMGRPWGNALCGAGAALLSLGIILIGRQMGCSALLVAACSVSGSYAAYSIAMLVVGRRTLRAAC